MRRPLYRLRPTNTVSQFSGSDCRVAAIPANSLNGIRQSQMFAEDSFTAPATRPAAKSRGELLTETVRETLRLYRGGLTPATIARERDLKESTVASHLANAVEAGEAIDLSQVFTPSQAAEMQAAFEQAGWAMLSGAHSVLGGRYDYSVLRLFRAARAAGLIGGSK